MNRHLVLTAVAFAVAACSRDRAAPAPAPSPATDAVAMSTLPPAPSASAAPAAEPPSSTPPTSFAAAAKVDVANAVGLGCEARAAAGWLELLCRKKNGTGGHPVRALLDPALLADAGEPGEGEDGDSAVDDDAGVPADDRGELRVVLPMREGIRQKHKFVWTDTTYLLDVVDAKASFTWAAAALPLHRACAELAAEAKKRVELADKAEGEARVTAQERTGAPRLGVCQEAGTGSWAVTPVRVSGVGAGSARRLRWELEVAFARASGEVVRAPLGVVEAPPGAFAVGPLRAFDYDDDGQDDLVVGYEVKAAAEGTSPTALPAMFTLRDGAIVPYPKAPPQAAGLLTTEQLDNDMRPDLATFGPYVAYLTAECGVKPCPPRLTGPRFFWHSAADGTFAEDEAARAALGRGCGKKPANIVAEAGGKAVLAQTAKNVVCARAFGAPADEVVAALDAKRALLCGEATSCPLATTLSAWARLPPPVGLP